MKVSLIGAGPYDLGLLTVKGEQAIINADVIIYDKLANPAILELNPGCERIYVGKSGGNHAVSQDKINQIILEKALEGKNVVRLKGGDPYLFGRGAEELDYLNENNVPYEVVPGITSAISVPAYGGIPVTHRDYASSLHIITGHFKEGKQLDINFEALVNTGGTLLFLMSVGTLNTICDGLLNAGMNPEMPAAIIENGTTSRQRKIVSTVSAIHQLAVANHIAPPSIFAVGQVCALSEKYDWFSKLPLSNVRVVLAGHLHTSGKMARMLYEQGCDVVNYPCIETVPDSIGFMEFYKNHMDAVDWLVFSSKQGVRYFFQAMQAQGLDIRRLAPYEFAAVGPETAGALREYGIQADFIPSVFNAETLAQELWGKVKKKAGLIRSANGSDTVKAILTQNGAACMEINVYKTITLKKESLSLSEIDYIAFTSASSVHGFVKNNSTQSIKGRHAVCIGNSTARAAESYGMEVSIAAEATAAAVVNKIMELSNHDSKAQKAQTN